MLEDLLSLSSLELFKLLVQEKRVFPTTVAYDMIINILVDRGIYPAVSKIGLSAKEMINNYGVHWNEYSEPLVCPHCGVDLRDLEHGPPFKRELARGDLLTDRVFEIACPDCGKKIE